VKSWAATSRDRWLARLALAAAALAFGAQAAEAHLVSTGVGPVYDGMAHFALTPEDIIPTVGMALLAGLRGPAHGRAALFALPSGWLVGGVVGEALGVPWGDSASALSMLAIGGLVALDAPLAPGLVLVIAGFVGALHGYGDGSSNPLDGNGIASLVGMVIAATVAFTVAAGLALPLRTRVARTAMRVIGSWIAAAGLLLLGWSLREGLIFSRIR
jgi:urease accessory protein